MHYSPKHSALRKSGSLRRRLLGVAVAGSATVAGWDRRQRARPGLQRLGPRRRLRERRQLAHQHRQRLLRWPAVHQPDLAGFGGGRYASRADLASKGAADRHRPEGARAQGPGAWPVCSVRAGLSRGNGGSVSSASRSTTRSPIKAHGTNAAYHGGRLAVDGVMGPNTTRALQRWVGTSADGVFGPQSARALQRKVGVHADGKVGRNTVRALQSRHRRQPRRCLAPQRPHRAGAAVVPEPPLTSIVPRRPDPAAGHELGSTTGPDGMPVRASGVSR